MGKNNLLNYEERKKIEEGLDENKMIKDIASSINRSISCVNEEIKKNGGLRKYKANLAQTNQENTLKERASKTSQTKEEAKKNIEKLEEKFNSLSDLERQINLMKLHIDILFDELKKLKENKND
jgi:IS30 family transposase